MSRNDAPAVGPQEILDFWFGAPDSAEFGTSARSGGSRMPRSIAASPGASARPSSGRCAASSTPGRQRRPARSRAVLLLDQFTRNAFRGDRRAFAGDAQALAAASALVGSRQDESLLPLMRAFAYLPFEHAESLAMQDEAVRLFTRLAATSPELAGMLDYAHGHRAVIERFGRFPHRNAILGRQSTAEELAHIATPGTAF